jgi:hypothetical protein
MVVTNLDAAQTALTQVSSLAGSTGNTDVSNLVPHALAGISHAHNAINRIGDQLVSGIKPSKTEYLIS